VTRIVSFAAAVATAALVAGAATRGRTADATSTIDIAPYDVGASPRNFELLQTGKGEPGQWTIVRDTTAMAGLAIEHVSDNQQENRYPLAIYKLLSSADVEINVRFKIIKGSMLTAGLVVRFLDADNYYVVSANALEERVDLFRVVRGRMERIWGTDADVGRYHWHKLGLVADHDQFKVSLDCRWLFTASDRTFLADGQIGLWVEEDNVTRFDQPEIRVLPTSEGR